MASEKVSVMVDNREMQSRVIGHLRDLDAELKLCNLKVGDYICSDRVGIEKKTVPDFLQSVFDQRLFNQLQALSDSYKRPILLIEGSPRALFSERKVSPNAIQGVLASIAVDYGVPMIWSSCPKESASQIHRIAYREQVLEKRDLKIRENKKPCSAARHQEYLVSGLPNVSNVLSRRLLKQFKTPKKVFMASENRLLKVPKIGPEKAKRIRELLDSDYKAD